MKKEKEKKKKHEKHAQPAETKEKAKVSAKPPVNEETPLQYAASAVGGKWKTRILWAMRSESPLRYGEIKQLVPGITDMMLSQSLREMAASGLVQRRQFQEIPPKVEYLLTAAGAELIPAIELLSAWAEKMLKA